MAGIHSLIQSRPLVDELRSEAADFDGTAGQYLADLLGRAADALESEYERGYADAVALYTGPRRA